MNKKAVVSILSTVFLIAILVSLFFVLQTWFLDYNSSFFSSLTEDKYLIEATKIRNNNLYLTSDSNFTLNSLNLVNSTYANVCSFSSSDFTSSFNLGENLIDITICNLKVGDVYLVSGYSSIGFFKSNLIYN